MSIQMMCRKLQLGQGSRRPRFGPPRRIYTDTLEKAIIRHPSGTQCEQHVFIRSQFNSVNPARLGIRHTLHLYSQARKSQIGGVLSRPSRRWPLNSNCGSGNCTLRQRGMPRRRNCGRGVNKIGSTSQSGCLRCGASLWIQPSATLRNPFDRRVGSGHPGYRRKSPYIQRQVSMSGLFSTVKSAA